MSTNSANASTATTTRRPPSTSAQNSLKTRTSPPSSRVSKAIDYPPAACSNRKSIVSSWCLNAEMTRKHGALSKGQLAKEIARIRETRPLREYAGMIEWWLERRAKRVNES